MILKKAVLVIDVQKSLSTGEGSCFKAADIIANINRVTFKARCVGVPVIFVQHEEAETLLSRGSDGWQLADELEKSQSDFYISKSSSDSFSSTELKKQLDLMKINHLVVCGMQSDFCVDSTIRHALALHYSITVVGDGHTTKDNAVLSAPDISAHHNSTWENITSYKSSAKVVPCSEIDF